MVIPRKGPFILGVVLSVSFFAILVVILSPVFGGRNGLGYADDLFNKLSKGSSQFIPMLIKENRENMGKPFRVAFAVEKGGAQVAQVLAATGAKVDLQGKRLIVEGDLGKVCQRALDDANHMFNNDGSYVAKAYGRDERQVMENWWTGFKGMDKSFKKSLQVHESNTVSEVTLKAIEPAYNYYHVQAQSMAERYGIVSLLLIFYVVYSLWWGYAILFLFTGLGLSMKKAKVKTEIG